MRRGQPSNDGRQLRTSPSFAGPVPWWWWRPPATARATGPAGPSAALDADGTFWLAYRLRRPLGAGRGYANVVARSEDGVEFETVTVLDREEFGSDSLERPALVPVGDGTWHLYVSCATRGRVTGGSTSSWPTIRPGSRPRRPPRCSRATRPSGVKDPVIKVIDGRWHMWLCCHPARPPRRHRSHVDPVRHQR